ncbi:MAG TPA: HAD-IA family hydrolase [Terriglobales bacterium]|jgi:phosphoglycolate phosphatase|nr:HAD-IA family hydrolase [Terriglobales bacterium]
MLKINRPIPDNVKLLVFDLDGTLVDSRQDLANSVNAMLRWLKRPELPCDVIATYIGDGAPMLVRRALGDPEDEQFLRKALEYFMLWYREHKLDTTYVYPGIQESLRAIRDSRNGSLKMAVLSNKPVNPSRAIVEALGLGEFFFQTYGGNSFETKKPDPLGALKLCDEAGVKPAEAVMIGDSQNDILTARNAGMWSIGLTYGLAPQTLEIYPPDVLLDKPLELATVFGVNANVPASDAAEVPPGEGFTG